MARTVQMLVLFFFLLAARTTLAAPPPDEADARPRSEVGPDGLFPEAHHFSATFASGLPFVGAGEVGYGFSDRFALGAMVGLTPDIGSMHGTVGVGLRPRGVVFASGPWRSVLVAPVLYYPKVEGFGEMDPWMLVQPTLTVERSIGHDASVHAGAGLIAAACMESITTLGKEHDMMGGVWNTATAGGAYRVSSNTTVFGEAGLVLRGVVPASDWIGGPAIAFVGVTRDL
jgi:hypothetical protein